MGGSSAGAMILGSYMVARDEEANPKNPEGSHHLILRHPFDAGFGFIPNLAIGAHVGSRHREEDLRQIVSVRPELLGVGSDETTGFRAR